MWLKVKKIFLITSLKLILYTLQIYIDVFMSPGTGQNVG